jgi:predicted nucleotidyltransferase
MAMDFASKVYKEFDTMIKSVIMFGSSSKHSQKPESDVDIIILLDDVSIKFDEELIAWYRKNLGKIMRENAYAKPLHVNSVKLSTWWEDMLKGDPVVMNVIRYGEALIDFGGFFNPLRILLKQGKIKSTPEAIYTLLERSPTHMVRAKQSMLAVIDGLYWTFVDSAHAALIAADVMPASPEEVPKVLTETFVKRKLLNKKYVDSYVSIHQVAKDIVHGKLHDVPGKTLDEWFVKSDEFLKEMSRLVQGSLKSKK